ncbi:MAG: hypothetical protein ABIP64_15710 [Burkholderiales bacterium]
MNSVEVLIPVDHPSVAGHFPGNPIIPGAVLLSEVVAAWHDIGNTQGVVTLRTAKFLSPTRPGDRVAIEFDGSPTGSVKFTCSVGTTVVASGTLSSAP